MPYVAASAGEAVFCALYAGNRVAAHKISVDIMSDKACFQISGAAYRAGASGNVQILRKHEFYAFNGDVTAAGGVVSRYGYSLHTALILVSVAVRFREYNAERYAPVRADVLYRYTQLNYASE